MKLKAIGHIQTDTVDLPEPDRCPRCGRSIVPIQAWDHAVGTPDYEVATVLLCPSDKCLKPFLAVYQIGSDGYRLVRLEPRSPSSWVRSKTIEGISPSFYDIYDQALAAEDNDLMHAAGPTYRKALEFLVKDYVLQEPIARFATAKESGDAAAKEAAVNDMRHITRLRLDTVIQQKIEDARIKDTATRAAWLGNDETHYTRKWEDHDLQDLKDLIGLVLRFIESHETYKAMLQRMPER